MCLAVFLGLTSWQLFVPPITGLSDNNDFAKVLGPAHICHSPSEYLNKYFVSGYDAGPKCSWPSGFTSTEILLIDLARWLSRPFSGRYHFDLRASAAIHLFILLIAMALLLRISARQPPRIRYLLPPLAILIFTDVAYVAYLNSAYMDNASWVLLLLLVTIAAQVTVDPASRWVAPAYALTGVLLIFSKAQHAVLGIPFTGLALYFALNWATARNAKSWLVTAAALLISTAIMPQLTPAGYSSISLYNLIFFRLAPADPTLLDQLGLDSDYAKFIGTQAFHTGSPLTDPDWSRAFVSRTSFRDVALLYLRHPAIALREIDYDLRTATYSIRPAYMANYRQDDGIPARTAATWFSLWSNLRSWLCLHYPHHLLVLYALPVLTAGVFRIRRGLPPLIVTLFVAGVCEFLVCSLADAVDTNRHLFLFQVITETLFLLTAAMWGGRLRRLRLPGRQRLRGV